MGSTRGFSLLGFASSLCVGSEPQWWWGDVGDGEYLGGIDSQPDGGELGEILDGVPMGALCCTCVVLDTVDFNVLGSVLSRHGLCTTDDLMSGSLG